VKPKAGRERFGRPHSDANWIDSLVGGPLKRQARGRGADVVSSRRQRRKVKRRSSCRPPGARICVHIENMERRVDRKAAMMITPGAGHRILIAPSQCRLKSAREETESSSKVMPDTDIGQAGGNHKADGSDRHDDA